MGRRGLLLGGAGLAAALGGGWYLFFRDDANPGDAAEEFVVTIDEESSAMPTISSTPTAPSTVPDGRRT